MRSWRFLVPLCWLLVMARVSAQPYGEPDKGQPGDEMIQQHLRRESEKLEADFPANFKSAEAWNQARPRLRQEYLHMLGLWPMPEKNPLRATVTRTLDRGDYVVEMLHYQSRPGLYVTGNLYRPAKMEAGRRLPAILYVCGHSGRGRDGNKTAFQSHGIWFARHGYVCLVVDTLQLGEIAGIHHGTYRESRWWWLSRGYTPAGVECWNGVRGIDYLLSRPDVDPERIGVTGISGGGAATFWIAAADDRVKVAAPVSGMADLVSYVPNRVINGHCDCMFLYNTYQWPWTQIAALIAPRPMLFVNSDQDRIFPMDANERVINRLERFYSLFGAGDLVDSFVSIGGHAYRADIRQGTFRFMNTWLKDDPRAVTDSEVDLVTGPREEIHPIPREQLRVFPLDSDIPADALNGRIDREFVPMANVAMPSPNGFEQWKGGLVRALREQTFHHFPERIPAAKTLQPGDASANREEGISVDAKIVRVRTEDGITIRIRSVKTPPNPQRVFMVVTTNDVTEAPPAWFDRAASERDAIYVCEPRGVGGTRWTAKNPPNYIARSLYLLGRTVESGRIWDIAAAARHLRANHNSAGGVHLVGEGESAALATYAALLESDIAGLFLRDPTPSHMEASAPALLNVLRVCDLPDVLGMLAPRPVTVMTGNADRFKKSSEIYSRAGAAEKLVFVR